MSEYFDFVSRDASIFEIENLLDKKPLDDKRLAVAFVTNSGSINESILGMITTWDLARTNS